MPRSYYNHQTIESNTKCNLHQSADYSTLMVVFVLCNPLSSELAQFCLQTSHAIPTIFWVTTIGERQNKKLVCMKLCAAKHYWCRSRYLCVCLLESWTPGESIVCWTHFVCLTSLHGLCHSRIGTQTHFFGPFYLWNGLLKDCQGHNRSVAWELSKKLPE